MTVENFFPNLRKLNNGDVFKLAKLIFKNAKTIKPYLADITKDETNTLDLGLDIIMEIAPVLGKEGYELVLGVTGMTQEEFEALPPASMFALVDAVKEGNDLQAFFDGANKLVSTFQKKDSAQKTQNTTSTTPLQVVTDGPNEK